MPTRLPSVLVRYFWPDSLSIRYRAPPPNTSQNVPTNSATARLIKDIFLSCGLISNRFLNVQRFFHRRIRQTEPLLQNTPRHPHSSPLERLVCVCAYAKSHLPPKPYRCMVSALCQ